MGGDNALTVAFLTAAILLLVVLIVYAAYELYQRRTAAEGELENAMCDTNKEVVVYINGVEIKARVIQTPSGITYFRVLEEYLSVINESAQTVAVIDRVERLAIGSTDFERKYKSLLAKYQHADKLRGLSFPFTVTTIIGGGSSLMVTTVNETYAEAELTGDAVLRLFSRNRRGVSMLSVQWLFPPDAQQTADVKAGADTRKQSADAKAGADTRKQSADAKAGADTRKQSQQQDAQPLTQHQLHWVIFGRIYDTNGAAVFDLKVSTAKNKHNYALFKSADCQQDASSTTSTSGGKSDKKSSLTPVLLVQGNTPFTKAAAKATGVTRTAMVFKVYRGKMELASIKPITDASTMTVPTASSERRPSFGRLGSPNSSGERRSSILSPPPMMDAAATFGDQLIKIKYQSIDIDPETKSAILGMAFLLCVRHCMKELYLTFKRVLANNEKQALY